MTPREELVTGPSHLILMINQMMIGAAQIRDLPLYSPPTSQPGKTIWAHEPRGFLASLSKAYAFPKKFT